MTNRQLKCHPSNRSSPSLYFQISLSVNDSSAIVLTHEPVSFPCLTLLLGSSVPALSQTDSFGLCTSSHPHCCQVSRVPIMSGDDTSRSLSATSQPSQKQQSSSSGNTKHTLILNSPAVLIKSTLLGNTGSDLTPSHCSVSLTSFPFRERTSPVTEWLTPRHLTPSSKASAR